MNAPNTILFKKIILVGGILYSFIFLIACFSGTIDPANFYGITYFALAFPFLLVGMIVWCIIAPLLYKNPGWVFSLLLLPAISHINKTVALNKETTFIQEKKSDQLRLLSWNVNEFAYGRISDTTWKMKQIQMVEYVKVSNADVLCFQDFVPVSYKDTISVLNYIADSLHYPFHYYSLDGKDYGTIIFSRIPIVDSGRVKYKEKVYPESLAYVDIVFNQQPLRIYNTHLRSMYLHQSVITPNTIGYLEYVKEDTGFLFHSTRIERLAYFDNIHTKQAKLVKEQLNKTNTPYIFCADLNAVPTSHVYHLLKRNMKDAFLEKGSGLGGTYHSISPTLRIDVILSSKSILTKQYYAPALDLSDHYPIIADLHLGN